MHEHGIVSLNWNEHVQFDLNLNSIYELDSTGQLAHFVHFLKLYSILNILLNSHIFTKIVLRKPEKDKFNYLNTNTYNF